MQTPNNNTDTGIRTTVAEAGGNFGSVSGTLAGIVGGIATNQCLASTFNFSLENLSNPLSIAILAELLVFAGLGAMIGRMTGLQIGYLLASLFSPAAHPSVFDQIELMKLEYKKRLTILFAQHSEQDFFDIIMEEILAELKEKKIRLEEEHRQLTKIEQSTGNSYLEHGILYKVKIAVMTEMTKLRIEKITFDVSDDVDKTNANSLKNHLTIDPELPKTPESVMFTTELMSGLGMVISYLIGFDLGTDEPSSNIAINTSSIMAGLACIPVGGSLAYILTKLILDLIVGRDTQTPYTTEIIEDTRNAINATWTSSMGSGKDEHKTAFIKYSIKYIRAQQAKIAGNEGKLLEHFLEIIIGRIEKGLTHRS